MRLYVVASVFFLFFSSSIDLAIAKATCFCKASLATMSGKKNATNVVYDLTATINKSTNFHACGVKTAFTDRCAADCISAAKNVSDKQYLDGFCSLGIHVPNSGSYLMNSFNNRIDLFIAVGGCKYESINYIGYVSTTEETYKCPSGWLSNKDNVDGGLTRDQKCKKLSAANISVKPLPADGTPIGGYGFTWGDGVWAWGNSSNGGASIKTPMQCGFSRIN